VPRRRSTGGEGTPSRSRATGRHRYPRLRSCRYPPGLDSGDDEQRRSWHARFPRDAAECGEDPAETSVWIVVDVAGEHPAYVIAPRWWVRPDMWRHHTAYLARYRRKHGRRRSRHRAVWLEMGPSRRATGRPGGQRIEDPARCPAMLRPSAPCQAALGYPHHSSTPPGAAAHTKPGVHETRDAP
jgi:hypothetical protein